MKRRRIQHKRTSVPGNRPTPEQLDVGEIAINFPDRYVYSKSDVGDIVRLTGHSSIVPPTEPQPGDNYIDPVTGKFYNFHTHPGGGGDEWIEVAPGENLGSLLALAGGGMQGPLEVLAPAAGDELVGFTQANYIIAQALAETVRLDGTTPMTGPLTLALHPVNPNDAACKEYVDAAVAAAAPDTSGYLLRSGGTLTGQLVLRGGSTGNQAAAVVELAAAIAAHEAQPNPHTQYIVHNDLNVHKSRGGTQHPVATPTVNGFHSKDDKKRFDALIPATTEEITEAKNHVKYVTPAGMATRLSTRIPARVREKLTADRTYYVRDDGNNNNDGLTDTATGAFLSWQRAVNVVAGLDLNEKKVTIKCTQYDVTFTAGAVIPRLVGITQPGNLLIQGNVAEPAKMFIDTTQSYGFRAEGGLCRVEGFKFKVTAANGDAAALSAASGGILEHRNNEFDAVKPQISYLGAHLLAEYQGRINTIGNYTVLGNGQAHMMAHTRSYITMVPHTVTFLATPTPRFAQYVWAALHSVVNLRGIITYVNDADGRHYAVTSRSVIAVTSSMPGDTDGTSSSGGVLIP